jgi:Uncharacterized protein conserved in bacteria
MTPMRMMALQPERTSFGTRETGGRVAVIAGSGLLPQNVADGLADQGQRPLVVAIEGEAEIGDAPQRYDLLPVAPEDLGKILPVLKRKGVTHLVMAGGVTRRPPLRNLRLGLGLLLQLPRLAAAYARGDDGLLRALVRIVESHGIKVVGAHEVVPELLAPEGVLTRARPTRADEKDIAAGLVAARALGRLDIGQGAVAIGARTVALEDIDGTDGLLQRAKALRGHGRLAGKTRGVLVKCSKPGQELRTDLPAIGPRTVRDAHSAGLAGIAVEAERSFILDCSETVRLANELGLFIVGFERGREG